MVKTRKLVLRSKKVVEDQEVSVSGSVPVSIGTRVGVLITPAQLAAAGNEHSEQVALMQWVAIVAMKRYGDLRRLHAIPNGGDRQAHVGAAMKAEGVKKGVPDLFLPVPMGKVGETWTGPGWEGHHGLYIEMKTRKAFAKKNNNLSPEQIDWLEYLRGAGYATSVAAGWQAAAWVLVLYLQGKLEMPEEGPLLASAVDIEPVLD